MMKTQLEQTKQKRTTTMPNITRLMRELRKRYATPAHVLRRLGLDASLLDASLHDDLGKPVQARYPAAHKFMLALARSGMTPQTAMRKLGMDAAMLDDEPGLREAFDQLMRKHFPDADDNNPFVNEANELMDKHVGSDPRGNDETAEEVVERFGSFDRRRPRGRDIEPLGGSDRRGKLRPCRSKTSAPTTATMTTSAAIFQRTAWTTRPSSGRSRLPRTHAGGVVLTGKIVTSGVVVIASRCVTTVALSLTRRWTQASAACSPAYGKFDLSPASTAPTAT
jgi:hypothetical protein